MSIQPIKTWYNGIEYRSRTEARWAAFFDLCGIKHFYEPEGYPSSKRGYLPDFYLEQFKCFVEIKPLLESNIKAGKENLEMLFEKDPGTGMILCSGYPIDNKIQVLCCDMADDSCSTYGIWREGLFVRMGKDVQLLLDGDCNHEYTSYNYETLPNIFGVVRLRVDNISSPPDFFQMEKEFASSLKFDHGNRHRAENVRRLLLK